MPPYQERAQQLVGHKRDPGALQPPMEDLDQQQGDGRTNQQYGDKDNLRDRFGIACSAQRAGEDKLGGLEGLHKGDKHQNPGTGFDDNRIGVIAGNNISAKEEENKGEDKRDAHADTPGAQAVAFCPGFVPPARWRKRRRPVLS